MEELGADTAASKKPSLIITLAIIALLSAVAGGGGWVVGSLMRPQEVPVTKKETPPTEGAETTDGTAPAETAEVSEDGLTRLSTELNGVVALPSITTNLAYPAENWVRMDVSLLFNGKPDLAVTESIHQDIVAYMRTVSLQQLQGPRGFQYLKEDIKERVDLRSEGRVTDIMFRTFVIE